MSRRRILNITTVLFAGLILSGNGLAQDTQNQTNGQAGSLQTTSPMGSNVSNPNPTGTTYNGTPSSTTTNGSVTTTGVTPTSSSTSTSTTTNGTTTNNQSMMPPPVQNKVFDAMVGTWTADSDFMGTKTTDNLTVQWDLNHQFLVMSLKAQAVSDPSKMYEGKGIFGIDKSGKAKTWWFDSWGAAAASTGTETFSNDNKLEIHDSNSMFSEVRTFEMISPTEMKMTAKGKMKMNGKEQSFDQTIIYRKS